MNVALRAVHECLQERGEPASRWTSLVAALHDRAGADGVVEAARIRPLLRSFGLAGTAGEWMANLQLLGVVGTDGRLDRQRATSVGIALELAGDSFAALGPASTWAPVATLPFELWALLHPPPIRHTAGALLDLVDSAAEEIHLAAPFVDPEAVEFLAEPLLGAGRRGASVTVVTSAGHAARFADVARRWNADLEIQGHLEVTELETHLSPLGSHAKVLVVDSERGYVGSANLTSAGLGRQIEIGVELAGPQLAELTRVLAALERIGTRVLTAGPLR